MLRVLYVGQCAEGSTSKMRFIALSEILKLKIDLIDISIPIFNCNFLSRAIGWRYYYGPLIWEINNYVQKKINDNLGFYDLVWIDKANFLNLRTVRILRSHSKILVHYTPDVAFVKFQSKLFMNALKYFDFCITTKSFEIFLYEKFGSKTTLFCSQGYHSDLHYPRHNWEERNGVVFVGLYEKSREIVLQRILDETNHILKLAGFGWSNFLKKNKSNSKLKYFGESVLGEKYAELLSSSKIGLGLLSKKFPESHTTRTFEIPACGAVLLTESNNEVRSFFNETEVVFFHDLNNLIFLLNFKNDFEAISKLGAKRVNLDGYDYKSILTKILLQIGVL